MTARSLAAPGHSNRPPRALDAHWLTLVFVAAVQFAAIVWFASSVNTQLGEMKQSMAAGGGVEHRLSVMETKLDVLIDRKSTDARR